MDLREKKAGLPLWGWGAVVVGGGVGFVLYRRRQSAAATAAAASSGVQSSDASTANPSDGVNAVGSPGASSYYYAPTTTTTASPAGTLTQSQIAAQTKLATDISSLSGAEREAGLLQESLAIKQTPALKQAYTTHAASEASTIAQLQARIQQDLLAISNGGSSASTS